MSDPIGSSTVLFAAGIAASAALLGWLLVYLLVRLAPRVGLLDSPNERSSHSQVTPRGGGVGFVVVTLLAGGSWYAVGGCQNGPAWAFYFVGALIVACISFLDDFRHIGVVPRILCHTISAILAIAGAGAYAVLDLPFGGGDMPWLVRQGLTVVWIIGLTNAYNFMDGIDGIAALQAIIAGLAWTAAGWCLGSSDIIVISALVSGGCFGFIIHNWSPARIFMGDVGSAFLGFCFSAIALIGQSGLLAESVKKGRIPVFALVVVWPFVGDAMFTFCRRAVNGEKVWAPHRSHLYQRLVIFGWSHPAVSSLYGFWAGLSALVALSYLTGTVPTLWFPVCFMAVSILCMLAVVRCAERKVSAG